MRVFLSGAVENTSDHGLSWRYDAAKLLEFHGLTPVFASTLPTGSGVNEIVQNNRFIQRSCDIVLAEYLIPDRAYVGTDYELACAKEWNQPAIIFAHEMYRSRVYLRYLATKIVPSLEEAIDYIAEYYPPEMKG